MTGIKKYLIVIFVVSLQLIAGAQNSGLYSHVLKQNSNRYKGKLMGEVYYLNAISNSRYFLQPDWTEGIIKLKDGDVFDGVKMRYMAYKDELVAYNENNHALFIVDKNTVSEFIFRVPGNNDAITERKFVNLDSLNLPNNKSYFELVYSGTAKLFAFHKIEEEKVTPYNYKDGKMYDVEFRLRTQYYIMSDVKGFVKLQLKNRSLYSVYNENKKEIRKLLRKNKISISDKESAKQAFVLLDSGGLLK
jgi:hypothetical protein